MWVSQVALRKPQGSCQGLSKLQGFLGVLVGPCALGGAQGPPRGSRRCLGSSRTSQASLRVHVV